MEKSYKIHNQKIPNTAIPNSGVSMAILSTIDISIKWYKLNFGPLGGQVKSGYLPERRDTS